MEHKRRHFEQYSGHSFYAFTINGILKILKRVQKQLKSGSYELYTMFQVFWSHMRALCEEQTEIKTIFTDNLPLQWTVILCDLISEPVSWSLGQISVFKELIVSSAHKAITWLQKSMNIAWSQMGHICDAFVVLFYHFAAWQAHLLSLC